MVQKGQLTIETEDFNKDFVDAVNLSCLSVTGKRRPLGKCVCGCCFAYQREDCEVLCLYTLAWM